MCCNCNYEYLKNCTCLVYKQKCIDAICCWCCIFQIWTVTQSKANFYQNLLADLQNAINNNKELKMLKKVVKVQCKDIEDLQLELQKILKNDYLQLIDGEQSIEQLVPEIELQLGQKIRLQLTEWEIYFEICRVILEMNIEYFTKKTYLNMFEFVNNVNKTLYQLVQLFLKVIKSQDNISFLETTKEKFIDLEMIIANFQKLLTDKLKKL